MFIRQTTTGSATDGTARITFRLVENRRIDGKVRQHTLLNLGRHFEIDHQDWPLLCQRTEELLSGQTVLNLVPHPPKIEAEARRIAARLLQRQGAETSPGDWETVDIASAADSDTRSLGIEHAALAALDMLRLPKLLDDLGFNRRQRCCALATIAARMAAPGLERATNRWLRRTSALGELLGIDFADLSDMALYRASDRLRVHQEKIEDHLFARAQSLFDFEPAIALYDMTNVFYESEAADQPKAKRGHSKENRTDCPLLTLGPVLDASGFVRRSRVFAGNVAECETLQGMLASLGAPRKAVVIMDRGIADDANLAWLRSNGYRYLVVSRDNTRIFDAEETRAIMTASRNRVDVYKEVVTKQEKDGTPFTEAHLRCFSEARAEKERSILRRFQERFESGLKKLHEGLAKPRTRKSLDHVQRRVGRLAKENTRVARHYNVTITPDQKASKAASVTWTFEPVAGTMMTHPGVYCLRSNVLDRDVDTMWKTYITLTDAEAVFRALKSELGLRPIFHQKENRADGHLFISVLAYQAVQLLRTPMKKAGYHDNWTSLRRILGTLQRTTTTFTRRGGKTLHVRKTATADADQLAIYQAMGIAPPRRNVHKTLI